MFCKNYRRNCSKSREPWGNFTITLRLLHIKISGGNYTEMTDVNNAPFIDNRRDCIQCQRKEKDILRLYDEYSYTCRLLENTRYVLEQSKVDHLSGSQIKGKVLEEVGSPESNTILCVPDPLNPTNKGNDLVYRLAEGKNKSFDSRFIA